ncbi:MAG: DUF1819 family protein [Caldilineaceae bacterium]
MITKWRASGPFTASSALFSGLLDETRLFLWTYAEQRGTVAKRVETTKQLLIEGRLPQRSRASRASIVSRISMRLTSWHPPTWVLDDLATFAGRTSPASLQAALLVHVCRQDPPLYALVQELVLPRWHGDDHAMVTMDVQRFLMRPPAHPEVRTWTGTTRARFCGMALTIFRDYGLLEGTSRKTIVAPDVPTEVAAHVSRLLEAEGVSHRDVAAHPDWRLWLGMKPRHSALTELVVSQHILTYIPRRNFGTCASGGPRKTSLLDPAIFHLHQHSPAGLRPGGDRLRGRTSPPVGRAR